MAGKTEQMIARVFGQIADGLETGSFGARPKIALTGMGSEHGEENAMAAAREAARAGVDVYYIGTLEAEGVTTVKVKDDEEGHQKMEELLEQGVVDGAVTMHYPFPIGVSTVGRAVTPGLGREMFIANTTGTSSTDRTEGMIADHRHPQRGRRKADRDGASGTAEERLPDPFCRIFPGGRRRRHAGK